MAFMYAVLYYDTGKAEATAYDEGKGRWTSIGHEDAGARVARDAVLRLIRDEKLAGYVENIPRYTCVPTTFRLSPNRNQRTGCSTGA